MNLSKEQIDEIAEVVADRMPSFFHHREDAVSSARFFLTEKFGAKEEWPVEESKIYFISCDGGIEVSEWGDLSIKARIGLESIGNIYRTKEEAENKVALLKHIYKFPEPKKGEEFWSQKDDLWDRFYYDHDWVDKQKYNSGGIMPLSSTEEDRAERVRLLKLSYS